MDLKEYFKVGYILKPHGLKGAVSVSFDADFPEETPLSVFVQLGDHVVPYFIESVSFKGTKGYLKFEDINSSEQAQTISGRALYLPKTSRPKSVRGEFYDDEVVGFEVLDKELGSLGSVTGVAAAGMNKLLSINFNEKEVLIPLNSPFIKSVNKSKKVITVELPDGYLEI